MNLRQIVQLPKLSKLSGMLGISSCFASKNNFSKKRQLLLTIGYAVPGVAATLAIAVPSSVLAETLRVGVAGSPPFIIRENDRISGIAVEIWQELARTKNIDYQFIPQPSVQDGLDAVNRKQREIEKIKEHWAYSTDQQDSKK